MELPKVNIAVAASAVVAIVSTVGGGIWYASQQASIIEGLTSQVERLTIENNATDRTNLIRDVEQNSENLDEMVDILVSMQEEFEEADEELWDEVGNMVNYFTQLVQLQSRVAILEKTVEFTRRDGM
jgi:mevalonate kinase